MTMDTLIRDISHEQFGACLNQPFQIRLEESGVAIELVRVAPWGEGQTDRRRPFSLTFRGPNDPVLSQRIYALENPALGTLDIFLVPIGPDKQGMQYEAVFT